MLEPRNADYGPKSNSQNLSVIDNAAAPQILPNRLVTPLTNKRRKLSLKSVLSSLQVTPLLISSYCRLFPRSCRGRCFFAHQSTEMLQKDRIQKNLQVQHLLEKLKSPRFRMLIM